MIIPPINAKGKFEFKEPFLSKFGIDKIYKVTAIRSLQDLYESEEDPYNNIYKKYELSDDDFNTDLSNNVPIIVLTTNGNDFYYIPASYILSTPQLVGKPYQEYVIGIKLGLLPTDYDFKLIKKNIEDIVRDTVGVISVSDIITTSATVLLDDIEAEKHNKLLENSKHIYKGNKTRIVELENELRAKNVLLKELENELRRRIQK